MEKRDKIVDKGSFTLAKLTAFYCDFDVFGMYQGTLTEKEGSVQLNSLVRYLPL